MNKLDIDSGKYLVSLARKAIKEYLTTEKKLAVPKDIISKLNEKHGVFVTLTSSPGNELRGCIGYPLPIKGLSEATIDSAIEASTRDPRFQPVKIDEFNTKIKVEVSVLTKPELIEVENPAYYPRNVRIGVDGLIIERGSYKGLLLPQVATEWNWNEEDFLSNCCMKAGLSPDAWLLEDTKVYKFQAVIFHETSPKGEIEQKLI